jgi:hypothetical protein
MYQTLQSCITFQLIAQIFLFNMHSVRIIALFLISAVRISYAVPTSSKPAAPGKLATRQVIEGVSCGYSDIRSCSVED